MSENETIAENEINIDEITIEDEIIPEKINYHGDNKKRCILFKLSDYDMNKDDRKKKYKDYDIVLCEKCHQKINRNWHCKNCYDKETEEEKHRMLYGICKRCSRAMKIRNWCLDCNSERFQRDFNNWTSGNPNVDKLIQNNQTSACYEYLLEWIPYDSFKNIKFLAKGGFASVYSAIWKDGRIEKWNQRTNNWERSKQLEVAIKVLNNSSEKLSGDFLNELNFLEKFPSYHYTHVTSCYGITREPGTRNYALVYKLKDCSLRTYLDEKYDTLTLKHKLEIIERICLALDCIHSYNIVHRDLHSGNILHSLIGEKRSDVSISDFGFCKPAYEVSKSDKKEKVYGVMPYMAPEILRGKEYTKESDIYSLGVIINEILFGNPPFHSRPFDEKLALGICGGLRPKIRTETPKPLEELIQKCWDQNPKNRPNINEIITMLRDFMYPKKVEVSYNFRKHTEQYEKLKEVKYGLVSEEFEESSCEIEIPIIVSSPSETQEINSQVVVKNKFTKRLLKVPKRLFHRISNSYKSKSSRYIVSESVVKKVTESDECFDCAINNNLIE